MLQWRSRLFWHLCHREGSGSVRDPMQRLENGMKNAKKTIGRFTYWWNYIYFLIYNMPVILPYMSTCQHVLLDAWSECIERVPINIPEVTWATEKKTKTTLLSIESWLFKKRDPHFMVYEAIPTYLGSISLDTHAGLPHHSWHPKMETFVLHHEWNGPRSLGKTIRECQEPKPFNHIFLKRWEMSSFRKCCYIKVVVPTHICVKLGIFS